MYAQQFDYHRAGSVGEAQKLLQQHPGAKMLAGGHSLIPLLKLRLTAPPALIDIGRIPELKGITASGGTIRIGALTTHAELASSSALKSGCPILPDAAAARARAVEAALTGERLSPDTIAKAAGLVSKDLGADVFGDLFASAEYRRAMAAVFVKRALAAALIRAS